MPVSDETKELLEQVKKGKARKFVMLTKGTSVVSLVLYKKGTASKYVKEAKESGKGAPCYGVVDGQGMNVRFQLAVSDGFKDAPVKDLVLKKFLEDEADFKCKPAFEVIDALPIVLDDADPLHARFMSLQISAAEAIERDPDRTAKLTSLARQIGALLDADDRAKAEAKIAEFAAELESSDAGSDAEQGTYQALRRKLEPLLLQATRADPEKATALNNVWNYADAQATAGKFAAANKALAGLADALKKAMAEAPQTDAARYAIPENIVAERKKFFEARWQQALDGVQRELGKLQQGIERELPDVNAAAITAGIDQQLQALFGDINSAVLGVTKATAADTTPLDAALAAVRRFRQALPRDERIQWLDQAKSELGVEVDVGATLTEALSELELKLAN